MTRLLVLFPKEWDVLHFRRRRDDDVRVYYEGFDLFSFPGNARLLSFDLFGFVERLAAKYRGIAIDAVLSNNEQFGALAAALLARRLGLAGLDPLALITAQHKFYARETLKSRVPEMLPRYCVLPYDVKRAIDVPLPFPLFVKPVKATFSVLARRVESFEDLRRHLSFGMLETLVIRRLVRPFNDAMAALTDFRIDAHHLIGESILSGKQLSVDGYAIGGVPHALGVVEATMYPGTNAFLRFDYPARITPALRSRLHAAAEAVVRGLGYDHGFFNVEFMVDPATQAISLIEVNPRMASQFSDLYLKVEGVSLHELALALACGNSPPPLRGAGPCGQATSFVFRRFDGCPAIRPTDEQVRALSDLDAEAHLMLYLKTGRALVREMKWLGSHRYAVLNMGAESAARLDEKIERATRILGFDLVHPTPDQRMQTAWI